VAALFNTFSSCGERSTAPGAVATGSGILSLCSELGVMVRSVLVVLAKVLERGR
jgi:hypothetical protein